MAFDINTAKPVSNGGGFDINSAKPFEEPEQPSKANMLKKGWDILTSGQAPEVISSGVSQVAQAAKDAYVGDAEFEGARSWEQYSDSLPMFGGLKAGKVALAGTFGTDEDKLNSIKHNFPDLQIQQDRNGNPYFMDKENKPVYIDDPGLDLGDIADVVGEGGTYALGGALTAPIQGVIKKTAAGALAQGGANVANQMLSGSDEIDTGEALTAGAMGGLFEGGGQLINKIRNARAGNLNVTDDAEKALDFAKNNPTGKELPIHYDDLTKNKTAKIVGQQMDQMPFVGSAKSRQVQNQAQKEVAEAVTKKFNLPDNQLDDVDGMIKGSAKRHELRSKEIASKKYARVEAKLDKAGDFNIPEVKQKATDIIEKELSKGSGANQDVITAMKTYMDIPEGNFSHWKDIRSDIVGLTRDAESSLSSKKGKVVNALKQVSNQLNKSMDNVADSTSPAIRQEWRDANSFYKGAVKRYKEGKLRTVMKNENPEKILDTLIGKGKGKGSDSAHEARQIFNGLDKTGKAQVKGSIMQKAFHESVDHTGDFSPSKYASMLEGYESRLGVMMSKQDKSMIDGLNKYMRFTQDAGNFAKNVPTGQKAVPAIYGLAAGSGAIANPGLTAAGALTVTATKKLFRTARGRSFMLALSKYPKGKKPPPELLTDIARYLAVKPSED